MSEKNSMTPLKDADYGRFVLPYQKAFGGDPWYEVSKCVDTERVKRCADGLSKVAVGELCRVCEVRPTRPAYEDAELMDKFEVLGEERQAMSYMEETEKGEVAVVAIVWPATVEDLIKEKYADIPEMAEWLTNELGADSSFLYLDEIFADKDVRPSGNLRNFRRMMEEFMEKMGQSTVAFRTINPALVRAAVRDFEEETAVYKRDEEVPDRRDFVIIRKGEE